MRIPPKQEDSKPEEEFSHILKVLGNHKRMEIIALLQHGEKTRREVQHQIRVSLEAVVKHLKELEEIGVIREVPKRGERGYVYAYFLVPDRLRQIGEGFEKVKEREFALPIETLRKIDPTIFQVPISEPRIVVDSGVDDGKEYPLKKECATIGRNPKSDIPITLDRFVSWNHARISQQESKYYLEDLGSTNKTVLNEKELYKTKTEIRNGDRFKIGKTWLKLATAQDAETFKKRAQ
jgi:DNA-binding HxlR family transcriptional regulator